MDITKIAIFDIFQLAGLNNLIVDIVSLEVMSNA